MNRSPSISEVHQSLLERISSGAFAIGAKLPPVRRLAESLGSNPSTVDRALQRLADAGLVRTVPREGTYVTSMEPPPVDVRQRLAMDLDRIIIRARAAGLAGDDLREEFAAALQRASRQPVVAFVECNKTDLEHMASMVENATDVELTRVMLNDSVEPLDETFEAVAAPLFHVADLVDRVPLDRVVELNFLPSPAALRELATLSSTARVVVALPTHRGLERISALVHQYYPGTVELFQSGEDDVRRLREFDVLVRTHASGLSPEAISSVGHDIVIEWELDQSSAKTFRSRLDTALRHTPDPANAPEPVTAPD